MPPQHDSHDEHENGSDAAAVPHAPPEKKPKGERRVKVSSPGSLNASGRGQYALRMQQYGLPDDPSPPIKHYDAPDEHAQKYPTAHEDAATRSVADSQGTSDFSDDSDATGVSSGERAARNAGMTKLRICGKKLRVSFITWTFLAMMVPVGFLVGSTAAAASESVNELSTIRHHIELATTGSNCVTAISEEHARTLRYILDQTNATLSDMDARRMQFHVSCTLAFQTELLFIRAKDAYFAKTFEAWALSSREIAVMRDRVDLMTTLTTAERARYTDSLQNAFDSTARAVTNAIALSADLIKTNAARYYINIKLTADARKALWTASASTLSLAGAAAGTNAAADLIRSLADIRAALAVVIALQGIASPELRTAIDAWQAEATTSRLLDDFTNLATRYPHMNRETFFNTAQTALDSLREIERSQLELARKSETVAKKVTNNLAVLCAGVAVCMVAAGLLTWQQLRTKNELQDQVLRAERTRKAVAAFIPKFFLHKMGYTSITQVQVGESTDVALAMMLCDIRKFATVSENMTSGELFTWVQAFFQRMTTTIDRSEGNISRFTGDSLFAVFSSCRSAIACAVDIQAEAQELNVGKLCREQNDIPVDLGIGLHHDVLAMGVLGDEGRHTVAAIASSVNQATRLQGLTKQLGCRILATDAVIDQLANRGRASRNKGTGEYDDGFLIRRVGPALQTSTGTSIVVYDIYQADDRLMQHYKTATKDQFEEYASLILDAQGAVDIGEREPNELRDELLQIAKDMGVHDVMTAELHVLLETRDAQELEDDKR